MKLKIGMIFLLIAVLAVSGCSDDSSVDEMTDEGGPAVPSAETDYGVELISTSFDDFGELYCDPDSTDDEIQQVFDAEYKDNFVKWSGTVYAVTNNGRTYTAQVKHCDASISDVGVTFKEDQNDKLVQYSKGDTITYVGRLTRFQKGVGLWVEEAVVA